MTEQTDFYVECGGEILADGLTYAEAVETLDEEADSLEELGWNIERGWASRGNYLAFKATRLSETRYGAVERDEI